VGTETVMKSKMEKMEGKKKVR